VEFPICLNLALYLLYGSDERVLTNYRAQILTPIHSIHLLVDLSCSDRRTIDALSSGVVRVADRIEREIEEILKKIDDFVPEKPRSVRKRPADKPVPAFNPQPRQTASPRSSGTGGSLARISLNQVMGWSLIAVLVAFFLPIPGSGWVILAALLVFGVAFLLSRMGGGSSSRGVEKRWRGEPMDLRGPSFAERLRDWIKGRRRS
jgi:hypothetical protein